MTDVIKREGDLPGQGSPGDTGALLSEAFEALAVKQESADAPAKLTGEAPKTTSRVVARRRGKPKGSEYAEIPSDLWIPYTYKYFVAHNDDGELEIYYWDTPTLELGNLYSVNPTNSVMKFYKGASKEFTMWSNTYKPDIPNQILRVGGHNLRHDLIVVLYGFEDARGFYDSKVASLTIGPSLMGPVTNVPHNGSNEFTESVVESFPELPNHGPAKFGTESTAAAHPGASFQQDHLGAGIPPPGSWGSDHSGTDTTNSLQQTESQSGQSAIDPNTSSLALHPSASGSSTGQSEVIPAEGEVLLEVPGGPHTKRSLKAHVAAFKKAYKACGAQAKVQCSHCKGKLTDLRPSSLVVSVG
ncbi:hypothetical protein FRC08_016362 [Ceratobasidium sp. 394]|nr:hypothetical protein FRC08_016362 [Ceratobasidium sp. 394]